MVRSLIKKERYALTTNSLTPVQPAERINEIDIIRGFALFGILMVNMSYFKAPLYFERSPSEFPAGIEQLSAWFIQLLFTGKFYAIFSFLFGLGFYIFMERAVEKGYKLVPLYKRRLFALLCFGLLHLVLFWSGDILFTYALGGFILLVFRKMSIDSIQKWIVGLFTASVLLNCILYFLKGMGEFLAGEDYQARLAEMMDSAIVAYNRYGFFELIAFRAENEIPNALISAVIGVFLVLPYFLCGLYAGKKEIFKNLRGNIAQMKKICKWGFLFGSLFLLLFSLIEIGIWPTHVMFRDSLLSAFNYVASIFLFPAYIASVLLALQANFWQRLLAPLASAGRMALTNYLSQTLICVLLFFGYGFGLYSKVSIAEGIIFTVIIYIFQIGFSNLWLRKFNYGPLEWLWRLLTYKKQPFMIEE